WSAIYDGVLLSVFALVDHIFSSLAIVPGRVVLIFFLFIRPPRISTLFPYTTLFRSRGRGAAGLCDGRPGPVHVRRLQPRRRAHRDRKSTRLNSSHVKISYAVFCLKKKTNARR